MLYQLLKRVFSPPEQQHDDGEVNPLASWYSGHSGRYITKWNHYFEIYHRHLARFRGKSPVVLEIGVCHGGSLDMWRQYFGAGCRLFGVDIALMCKIFENDYTKILIGDQANRDFLARLRNEVPRIDVLIDDGGHTMNQQIATFEELYPHIADDGVYLCEDMLTSYWKEYGGGYQAHGSFIEYSKALVDQLNSWHSREPDRFQVSDFTRTTYSMHYYNSVLVIEKRPMEPPFVTEKGRFSF
jgi:hypothetical protein